MQAACAVGNQTVLRLLVEEGAFKVCGEIPSVASRARGA
jgi:hypothetical protein